MSTRISTGSPQAAIIEDEERLHARVQARVALGTDDGRVRVNADEFDKELIKLRDAIVEAKPEDLPPLVEQMTRMSAIRARLGGSRTLPIDPESPYFAHMVIREGERARDVMIGKRGFIDRNAGVQIVDWRNAPISQVYYRYEEGDDFDEEVDGRKLVGLVEIRRNVSIHAAKLKRIGSPQGTFIRGVDGAWHQATGELTPTLKGGSGKAVRVPKPPPSFKKAAGSKNSRRHKRKKEKRNAVLGVHHEGSQRADKHLPEIAALIDAEQFDLITQPESGLIVIQGGAGSGKTTVALHRVAFINFASPHRFRPNRILFVVPTNSLARYVVGVLPSLGVNGVPVETYSAWASKMRLKLLRGSGKKYNDDAPDEVTRLKKHPALISMLEAFVADQVADVEATLSALSGSTEPMKKWHRLGDDALVPRLRKLYTWIRGSEVLAREERVRFEGTIKRLGRRANDIVNDWAEFLTDEERLVAGFKDFAEAEGSPPVARAAIARVVSWCLEQQSDDGPEAGADGQEIKSADGRALDEDSISGQFDHDDDPILLRLVQLKRGGLMSKDVKEIWYEHVAIDEAQDRSALEVKVLLEATAAEDDDPLRRSVTIAGDTAQRLVFDNNFSDWGELLRHTGHTGADAADLVKPLRLSYRATAEVMQLAREILGPELMPEEPLMARSGAPVELHEFGDIGEAVGFLGNALRGLMLREPNASVAVIARYPEQADAYFAGLLRTEVPAMRRVRNHEFTFVPGVDVTDVAQVKGLEFDYVVMVEVNAATYGDNVESRHLLHIGATRAAHQLWLISTSEPSKLLPDSIRIGGSFVLEDGADAAESADAARP